MAVPSIKLFNGHSMPLVGAGTLLRGATDNHKGLKKALDEALKAGYRHFDTAYQYQNEAAVGDVLKRWLDSEKIQREELFIVTKLPPIGMRPEHVPHFLEKSLKSLQLDYVDLYLIHNPVGWQYVNDETIVPMGGDGKILLDKSTDLKAIWRALEAQVERGLARSIGVSNFTRGQIARILEVARIQPANNQIELHAYFQRPELLAYCRKHNISVVSYATIGSPNRKDFYTKRGVAFEALPIMMEDPVVKDIAKKSGKTPSQILMKLWVQQGISIIPTSTNPVRLRQNLDLFNFQLSNDDMARLKALDRGKEGETFGRKNVIPGMEEHPEAYHDD